MKRFAAIDIGAHAVKLKIIEYVQDKSRVLEDIMTPLKLGVVVFERGTIDRNSLDALYNILVDFMRLMEEYKVHSWRAVATGVIREASNGRFAIALLNQRTQLNIEIIEESVERFLTYTALQIRLPHYNKKRKEGMLVVEVGSASSEILVYKDNKLVRSNEMHLGTLKLKSMMREIERVSLYTAQIMEDHVFAMTANLQSYLLRQQIHHFVVIGADMKNLKELLFEKDANLQVTDFSKLVHLIYKRDPALKSKLEANQIDFDELMAAVIIFHQFLKHTNCTEIEIPPIALRDGILQAMLENTEDFNRTSVHTKDVLSAARYVAKRYHSTMPHVRQLERHVVKIFDCYKTVEGFTEKDLLHLRLATILHETGKFSRQSNYHTATYQSITHTSLLGLTQNAVERVAQIAMQSFSFSGEEREDALELSIEVDLKTVKLGLIMALADALDRSKRQFLRIEEVYIELDQLHVSCDVLGTTFLEEWAVKQLKPAIQDVFGHNLLLDIVEVDA